jgi:hypothetical protein
MSLTDDQAFDLYLRSLEAEAKAAAISRRVRGFAVRFETQYTAWRNANATSLSRGEAVATARGMTGDSPHSIQSFAALQALVIARLPADDLTRRGEELLASLHIKH